MTTQINGDTGVSQCQPNSVSQDDLQSNVVGKGPAFSVYSTIPQAIPDDVVTTLKYNAEHYNIGGFLNKSNGRFQPSVAGYYQVSGGIAIDGSISGNGAFCGIKKNGASFATGNSENIATAIRMNMSTLVYLNGSTDYIEFFVYCQPALPTYSGEELFYFNGVLVRAA